MSITEHVYTATVRRPGRRDAVLRIRGGRISLDATGAPRCLATIEAAVPRHWAPIFPNDAGYWEDTGAPQYPFLPGPPFRISAPARRWVSAESWDNGPLEDEDPEVVAPPLEADFFPGPPFTISAGTPATTPAPPQEADLQDIDPRDNPRVVILAERTDAFGVVQTRSFDLALRERAVSQSTGRITLSLASDEALLQDYAPLADDRYPLLAGNMYELVQHVLTTVMPGVVLDSVPTYRAVRPVWSTTQLLINGTFRLDVAGWVSNAGTVTRDAGAGDAGGSGYARVQHTAATGTLVGAETITGEDPETHWVNASPGDQFTISASLRSASVMNVRLGIAYRAADGTVLASHSDDTLWTLPDHWERLNYTAPPAPIGTARVSPLVEWTGSSAGRVMLVDDVTLVEGEFDPGWFDGATPPTTTYAYTWRGNPDASQSYRELLIDGTDPESLVWRAGVDAFSFLNPHVQAAGWRLVCDENRVWKVRAENARNPGHLAIAYADNLVDGADTISRTDDTWFDAAVVEYEWTASGLRQTRLDTYAATMPHTRLRRIRIAAPYPGPGLAEYAVRRALGRGRKVTATAVADWSANTEMDTTVTLNGAPKLTGITDSVEFDLGNDEMTITTRTTDIGSTP